MADRLWEEKVAGGTLKHSPALKKALADSIRWIELQSPAGLYLGKVRGVAMNRRRIHRVVERTVRGLLWHHYRVIPPSDIEIKTWDDPDVSPIQDMLIADTRLSNLGGEVFRYRHGTAIEDANWSMWFLSFYEKATFLTMLWPKDSESENASDLPIAGKAG